MRIASAVSTFETNIVDIKPQAFQIQASAKAFEILSNSLYSNKPLAVVRELITNAYDAHRSAGTQDIPIEIHFPTTLEPWLEVKDFGTGLSDGAILSLYTTYFASNKTDSDELIGGFGLGSKSPFAYTDQFTVESRYNGTKTMFQIYVSASKIPMVTQISKNCATERNGLTVRVPVGSDRVSFQECGSQILRHAPWPVVTNIAVEKIKPTFEIELPLDAKATMHREYDPRIIMGNVPYPISIPDWIKFFPNSTEYYTLVRLMQGTHLRVPVGTFDIAASREALAVTDAGGKTLTLLLTALSSAVKAHVADQFADCKTAAEMGHFIEMIKKSVVMDFTHLIDEFTTEARKHPPPDPIVMSMVRRLTVRTTARGRSTWRLVADAENRTRDPVEMCELICRGIQVNYKIAPVAAFYHLEKDRPYASFFGGGADLQDSYADKILPALLFTGDKARIEQWLKDLGFDAVLKTIPVQKRAVNPLRTKRAAYGAHKYTVAFEGRNGTRYTIDEIINEQNISADHIVIQLPKQLRPITNEIYSLMQAGGPNVRAKFAVIDAVASHNKVFDRLIAGGAFDNRTQPNNTALIDHYKDDFDWTHISNLVAHQHWKQQQQQQQQQQTRHAHPVLELLRGAANSMVLGSSNTWVEKLLRDEGANDLRDLIERARAFLIAFSAAEAHLPPAFISGAKRHGNVDAAVDRLNAAVHQLGRDFTTARQRYGTWIDDLFELVAHRFSEYSGYNGGTSTQAALIGSLISALIQEKV